MPCVFPSCDFRTTVVQRPTAARFRGPKCGFDLSDRGSSVTGTKTRFTCRSRAVNGDTVEECLTRSSASPAQLPDSEHVIGARMASTDCVSKPVDKMFECDLWALMIAAPAFCLKKGHCFSKNFATVGAVQSRGRKINGKFSLTLAELFGGLAAGSVARNRRVHQAGPGVDAADQIGHAGET